MKIHILQSAEELQKYDVSIRAHPFGNFWQSLERKKYYEALGKEVRMYCADDFSASALIVIDRTLFGYSVWDIPRGPLWNNEVSVQMLMKKIVEDATKERCMEIYFSSLKGYSLLAIRYWLGISYRSIYPRATRIINLDCTDEDLLKQMHPKGRYNIKLAEKNGVSIRTGSIDDIATFYSLLQDTAKRDGFTILPRSHYEQFLQCHANSFLLIAEHDKKPIAGLIGVTWNTQGIYYYGASDHASRALMAPYLLQYRAMQECKKNGCTSYDLLGISHPDATYGDSWAGITDFKRKFGGEVILYPQEQKIVLRPMVAWMVRMKRVFFNFTFFCRYKRK